MNFESEINTYLLDKSIDSYKIKDNTIIIKVKSIKLSINCPKNNKEYFIVDSREHMDWLDEINIKIIQKKLCFDDVMKFIINKVEESPPIQSINECNFGQNSKINIDEYDIEYYKIKKHLEDCISTSKSLINLENSGLNRIFDSRTVANVIIGEFMNTWKEFKNNEKIHLDIKDNNIYNWNIKIQRFSNNDLNENLKKLQVQYGYNYLEFDLHFHDKLYPNYPPIVKILRPRLNDLLMHKIANCRMVSLDFWTPARDCIFIINKIYKILDKHASIDLNTDLNDRLKYPNGAFMILEDNLLKLASLTNIKQTDDLDDQVYESIKDCINKKTGSANNNKKQYWAKGTGYGHSGNNVWNIDAYIKSQEEKDRQIVNVLRNIIIELENSNDCKLLYNTIKCSYLIPYIKSMLNSITLLEIANHIELYKIIFNLLAILSNEEAVHLFYEKEKDLFSCLDELNSICATALQLDRNNVDEIVHTIMTIYSMIKIPYDNYKQTMIDLENEQILTEQQKLTEIEKYSKELNDSKFEISSIINSDGQDFYYKKTLESDKLMNVTYQKRLIKEVMTLKQSLPIHYDASIFLRMDPDNMSVYRALITGPSDTPYDSGCFIFDMYIPNNFPNVPPTVWFITHGGKRFNPNLYDSGKLCLSLLGTWSGDKGGESWNSKTSTLYQVFISIQSQILTSRPYFNEPGYEKEINAASGIIKNEQYNNKIRMYTLTHSIKDILLNIDRYPQFTEVIKKHFSLKKNYILNLCEKWTKEARETLTFKKHDFEKISNEIKNLLDKLN